MHFTVNPEYVLGIGQLLKVLSVEVTPMRKTFKGGGDE